MSLIDNQAAIEAIHTACDGVISFNGDSVYEVASYFEDAILGVPPAQQWHTEPPEEWGFYIACSDLGVVGECVYTADGKWDTDRNYRFPMFCQIVAWMPMPKPYPYKVKK